MKTLLFVYGTLKRGCRNHHHLAGQKFVGTARTRPGFHLIDLGGYPGIVAQAEDRAGVSGEVWSVDEACLRQLDHFEGVHDGLYRREPRPLQTPFADCTVDAYLPASGASVGRDLGSEWIE